MTRSILHFIQVCPKQIRVDFHWYKVFFVDVIARKSKRKRGSRRSRAVLVGSFACRTMRVTTVRLVCRFHIPFFHFNQPSVRKLFRVEGYIAAATGFFVLGVLYPFGAFFGFRVRPSFSDSVIVSHLIRFKRLLFGSICFQLFSGCFRFQFHPFQASSFRFNFFFPADVSSDFFRLQLIRSSIQIPSARTPPK